MVAITFSILGCGLCFHCVNGQPQLCADMRFIGGQTGDVLGASQQVFEAAILLVLAGNWA